MNIPVIVLRLSTSIVSLEVLLGTGLTSSVAFDAETKNNKNVVLLYIKKSQKMTTCKAT